ncbi:MAG: hypothetical protein N2376_03805 [Clostridia bacterium]|nr:hypothetical protein [Clostridia bacterium]
MNRLMANRYGIDAYSIFLFLLSPMFLQTHYLWVIGIFITGYALFRIFSKDKAKRYAEFQKFTHIVQQFLFKANQAIARVKAFFSLRTKRFQERKSFVYLKCPKCRRFLRLPRKKGKLEVTCPVCKEVFIRKT